MYMYFLYWITSYNRLLFFLDDPDCGIVTAICVEVARHICFSLHPASNSSEPLPIGDGEVQSSTYWSWRPSVINRPMEYIPRVLGANVLDTEVVLPTDGIFELKSTVKTIVANQLWDIISKEYLSYIITSTLDQDVVLGGVNWEHSSCSQRKTGASSSLFHLLRSSTGTKPPTQTFQSPSYQLRPQ